MMSSLTQKSICMFSLSGKCNVQADIKAGTVVVTLILHREQPYDGAHPEKGRTQTQKLV